VAIGVALVVVWIILFATVFSTVACLGNSSC
jgi:hypothetical protein